MTASPGRPRLFALTVWAIVCVAPLTSCTSARPEDLEWLLGTATAQLLPAGVELLDRSEQDTEFRVPDLTSHPSQLARVVSAYHADDPDAAFAAFAASLENEEFCGGRSESSTTDLFICSDDQSSVKILRGEEGNIIVTLEGFQYE